MGVERTLPTTTRGVWRMPQAAERRFHTALTLAILAAVFLGFARTFFLKPWFPEAAPLVPPEPFFYVHGVFFTAWFVLLVVQPWLIAARRTDLHRRLGRLGAGLAALMVPLGVIGALIAARRPTGFIGVSVPPLQFLALPLAELAFFAVVVTLAVVKRRDTQSHKRLMLLGSIALAEAGITRWPFAIMLAESPIPFFTVSELLTDCFLIPMVIWDLISRGRLHPVTLWGGLALIALPPLRLKFSETDAWMAFATWAVSLLG